MVGLKVRCGFVSQKGTCSMLSRCTFPVASRMSSCLQEVYAKVHEIMTGNLGAAGTSQGLNISPGSQGLLIVCASMRVLGVLEECCKDYANRFTHVLVKLINRVARDHASPGGFVLDSSRQAGRNRYIPLHRQKVQSCTPHCLLHWNWCRAMCSCGALCIYRSL